MTLSFTARKRIRKSFGKIAESIPMPDLIKVQKSSYDQFLQIRREPEKQRSNDGLEAVFKSIFPIDDFSCRAKLEYLSYEFEEPKFDVAECMQRDLTYAASLKALLRLIVFEADEDTGARSIRDIKEQEVYLGDIPLMTDKGTFVINGTERVVVSQMHRSPGVFFDHDRGKTHMSGKLLYTARIIPYRGSWLDLEFDPKDILYVRIDRKRKIPATILLRAMGYDAGKILATYYSRIELRHTSKGWSTAFDPKHWSGVRPESNIINAGTGRTAFAAEKKISLGKARKAAKEGLKTISLNQRFLHGQIAAADMVNPETGEIYVEAGQALDEATAEILRESGLASISILAPPGDNVRGPELLNTMLVDHCDNRADALAEIYRVMRPGEPPTEDAYETLFRQLFFDPERYDLSAVGRAKMNMRLGFEMDDATIDKTRTLREQDIVEIVRVILDLKDNRGEIDDIDNLGNRRVRSVGELLENSFRTGLSRMERSIKERLSSVDIDKAMPHDLVNAKPVVVAVREFFGSSQLSQFMDQTNPLSEITHKRRLSALGPGGLTRERAGFEVRDVHPTHYGRICPIETPEGPNIGLINSLATYAGINRYGFIDSPYRKVKNGRLTDVVEYLSASEEARYKIAQANAKVDDDGFLVNEFVNARVAGDVMLVQRSDIQYMDVSPKQVVSVAAALIPFLENDDANRALMGSNMQRQAVPLLQARAPLVGTGMEEVVARDSKAVVTTRSDGVVEQVDSTRIVIREVDLYRLAASQKPAIAVGDVIETKDAIAKKSKGNPAVIANRPGVIERVESTRVVVRPTGDLDTDKSGVEIYRLSKFQRSNQNSCINQRPIVKVGDVVEADDIIADGPSTDLGELALGRNILVAFMPWNGYNFEDSILISEHVVRDDVFTSIHIEEFEINSRDTKLGPEEITRDIPNVGEEALRNLDEAGIVAIGAEVEAGDILVGKVTPKGESPVTPEEKLLRAIFGEKASDVRDSSLRVPPGNGGTVVEVRIFNRHGIEKDQRALQIERERVDALLTDRDDEISIIERSAHDRLRDLLIGQNAVATPKEMPKGKLSEEALDAIPRRLWWEIGVGDPKVQTQIDAIGKALQQGVDLIRKRCDDRKEKLLRGDDLPPGVMKVVKVFVAVKRKLQPGDKMAGRHGNKGVISRINPIEDMPHLEDGTPVDVVLNPLGVPSRMNVGQILETHLGWSSAGLAKCVDKALRSYRRSGQIEHLRQQLAEIYTDKELLSHSDSELEELADNVVDGIPMASPVFDGASQDDICQMLEQAGFDASGQSILYDGHSGQKFARPVTVGYKYLLKLHHLVDDKIHARSTGPYSMVTQQPLGGKAQFGGQRFGEMEVWALEAYGAAYTLQEMLTVKSDDTAGRAKVYEAIVRGDDAFEAGIPEGFNVLIKEMRSLGLNIDLIENAEDKKMLDTEN